MPLTPTTQLISEPPAHGRTFTDVLAHSSGSAAGFSANSEWLSCPEKSRLRAMGLKHKGWGAAEKNELNALEFGTLMHELLRYRVWYGHEAAVGQLTAWAPELRDSYVKAALMLATYEQTFPQATEPLRFLGVECEVVTNIRMGPDDPRPCFRSVRYDGIVLASGGPDTAPQLYSLERKTTARSGSMAGYTPQGMVQMALWNSNKALVDQYGPMRGIIFEPLIKTKNPSCDRVPAYFSPEQERLALTYMRYSENGTVTFQQLPDGSYPKMLHACWGKYSPCDFINFCHEGVTGDYLLNGEEIE